MKNPPNILVFMTDQQHHATIRSDNLCQTPNIDRLTRNGVHFRNAFCPSPICTPSRSSFQTGLFPHQHHHTHNIHFGKYAHIIEEFPANTPLLGDALSANGYRTAYLGKWDSGLEKSPLDYGYDIYDGNPGKPASRQSLDLTEHVRIPGEADEKMGIISAVTNEPPQATAPFRVAQRTVDTIHKWSSGPEPGKPFFIFASTVNPHVPWLCPEKYTRLYDPADIPERGIKVDDWGIHRTWIEHETGGYWDFCDFPLEHATEDEVAAWPLPSPDDFDYSRVPELCKKQRDYAVFTGSAGTPDIINGNGMLRGMEETLVDLITDDPAGLLLARRRCKTTLEILRRTLEAAKGGIDFLWLGEDLGTQQAPIISLKLYRRHLKPLHQTFVDLAKSFDIPAMVHTCGSSSWAYEDFIAMGIKAVDTLQPEAKDMSPAYLKRTFGGRLAFHGCISTAGPVAYGTVEETVQYCRDTLDIMMPGGGSCFAPTHQLQDNFTPMAVGGLPEPMTSHLMRHIPTQEMIVEAGLTGDRDLAVEASAPDPMVPSPDIAQKIAADVFNEFKDYLPQYNK